MNLVTPRKIIAQYCPRQQQQQRQKQNDPQVYPPLVDLFQRTKPTDWRTDGNLSFPKPIPNVGPAAAAAAHRHFFQSKTVTNVCDDTATMGSYQQLRERCTSCQMLVGSVAFARCENCWRFWLGKGLQLAWDVSVVDRLILLAIFLRFEINHLQSRIRNRDFW